MVWSPVETRSRPCWFNNSGEAANAYLDWLAIVARDEIAALRQVETFAQALVERRTLTAAEIKALLARA